MKKYVLTFAAASVFAAIGYFILEKNTVQHIWIGALLIGLALSGSAVSGDRMSGNQKTGMKSFERNYFLYPLLFGVPFFILDSFFDSII